MAEGRTLGDPETVHYGLVPRTNRGIFSVNELPDLAERIQVALLNVLEERDIQVRGYQLRLPLDLILIASANPEDYTNRGRIITPLKDRFGAEVRLPAAPGRRAHPDPPGGRAGLGRAAPGPAGGPRPRAGGDRPLHPGGARVAPDRRLPGGLYRFAIAAAETVGASAARRAAVTGEAPPVARVVDLWATVPVSLGKVEFDQLEEGRELELLKHLLRCLVAETWRPAWPGPTCRGCCAASTRAPPSRPATWSWRTSCCRESGLRRAGPACCGRLGDDSGAETPGLAAAALEFAMEGLHLAKRLAKEELPGRTVYGG